MYFKSSITTIHTIHRHLSDTYRRYTTIILQLKRQSHTSNICTSDYQTSFERYSINVSLRSKPQAVVYILQRWILCLPICKLIPEYWRLWRCYSCNCLSINTYNTIVRFHVLCYLHQRCACLVVPHIQLCSPLHQLLDNQGMAFHTCQMQWCPE